MEKFKAIYFSLFRLADTNNFFMAPLQKLVESLNSDGSTCNFPLLREQEVVKTNGVLDPRKLQLLTSSKGIYPYQ